MSKFIEEKNEMKKTGTTLVRNSKYRHTFGTPGQTQDMVNSLKLGSLQVESNIVKTNSTYFAVPWGLTGTVAVIPLSFRAAVPVDLAVVGIPESGINEFNFNPFDDSLLATANNDGSVAYYKIPQGGPTSDISTPSNSFKASDKRVMSVDFHPLAANTVLTTDAGKSIKIWDVEQTSAPKIEIPGTTFGGVVTNISFSSQGSHFAVAAKDKKLRVFDPRSGTKPAQEGADHPGTKGSRVIWLGNRDRIVTLGFDAGSERQMHLFDPRKLGEKIAVVKVDASPSSLLPFYDEDTQLLYTAGKGDANIRIYEIDDQGPFIHYLNEFKSKDPQAGLSMLPKKLCKTETCEVANFIKVTPSGWAVPIRFEVPRKDYSGFQEDLYPPTWDGKPSMSASEWFGGANKPANTYSLEKKQ